jgi:hypothetical protein
LVSLTALVAPISSGFGGTPPKDKHVDGISVYIASELTWQNAPTFLPSGAKLAVLEGDPSKEGPFVMRLRLPDGYRLAPHTHPKPKRVTVIAGTFYIGTGEKFDPKMAQPMPTGSYGTWPAGMKHFVWTEGVTVIQLHGFGPWSISYVNPADDPRISKK